MATITQGRAAPAISDTAATHPYTCNSCQVAFRNSELQRGHMRSDWHRYNLKRRVTSLPPISSEVFTDKVLQAQASSTAAASRAAYERTCTPCTKTYFSENAFDNHLGSAKHKSRIASLRAAGHYGDTDVESVVSTALDRESVTTGMESDIDDDVRPVALVLKSTALGEASAEVETKDNAEDIKGEISLVKCLFCNYDSPTTDLNVHHMERIHGMFLPEKPYLVDLDGLLKSLNERVRELHECLFCQKLKPTVFGLQTHMRDTGHCKIPFDTEEQQLEIGEFYDFRSTYSDDEDDGEDESDEHGGQKRGGVMLGARRSAKTDDAEMEDAEGWETDSSVSTIDSAEIGSLPKDGYLNHAHKHTHAAFYSDYELHLPSGKAVGHRSLAKYYKQNLVNHPSPSERQEQLAIAAARTLDSDDDAPSDRRLQLGNDRGRGRAVAARDNLGMVGVTDQKKREVTIEEKRARKTAERQRRQYEWGNNRAGNSQKHFRDPLLQ